MGVVYRAVHRRLHRDVALKLLRSELSEDPSYKDRFLQEGQLAASVHDPHVVTVYDVDEVDDRLYLAMRWIDGSDLGDIMTREGPLAPARVVHIVMQISRALDAVHRTMVHRDVKPANILVSNDGRAYLTDFGIARPDSTDRALTRAGAIIGTPGYISPEQIRGLDLDGRADFYALGCAFFEAITGAPPFDAANDAARSWEHANSPRPLVSDFLETHDRCFDGFLQVAMAIEPAKRYGSGEAFALALEAAASRGALSTGVTPHLARADGDTHPRTVTTPVTPADHRRRSAGNRVVSASAAHDSAGTPQANRKRLGSPVALMVIAIIALGGLAVGVLAAARGFSSTGPAARAQVLAPDRASETAVAPTTGPTQSGWQTPVNLGGGPLGSAPAAGVDAGGNDYVFWRGTNGALWDKWFLGGQWHGPAPIAAAGTQLASPPSVAVHADGRQDVFWKGTNGNLYELTWLP
jgi:predicted Ser/Thr protein kinase